MGSDHFRTLAKLGILRENFPQIFSPLWAKLGPARLQYFSKVSIHKLLFLENFRFANRRCWSLRVGISLYQVTRVTPFAVYTTPSSLLGSLLIMSLYGNKMKIVVFLSQVELQ